MNATSFPVTLVDALQQTAKGNKSITYIKAKNDELRVSYTELYTRALQLLYQLQQAGVKQGDELILLAESNEQFVDVFWAAILGGIIVVPLNASSQNTAQKRVLAVFQKLNKPFVWTSSDALEQLFSYADEQQLGHMKALLQQQVVLAEQLLPDQNQATPAEINPQHTAFIQFSSGSTGEPKGVVLSHHNLMTNIASILIGSKATEEDVSLSWMPLTHDMGIIGFHLSPLVLNTDVYLMSSELFVRRPNLWLDKISEKKATVSAAPNFAYQHILKYFKPEKQAHLDLSSLRLIFNGAEQISAAICREFNQVLKPFGFKETVIFPVYGLAEASLASAFTEPALAIQSIFINRQRLQLGDEIILSSAEQADSLEMVLLGKPVSNTGLVIANNSGQELPELTLGHVLIRGENVTKGYYDDSQLNSETINAEGWLDTGDIGFMYQQQLVLTGRFKDLIIVNGQNYHAHDLEQLCEGLPEIGKHKVAACAIPGQDGEALAVFVSYKADLQNFIPMANAIRAALAKDAGIEVAEVIPVSAFPKTTSGKVQRFNLSNQFIAGAYADTLAEIKQITAPKSEEEPSEEGSIEQQLLQICKEVIPEREIVPNDDLFEIGISSLSLTQIHERLDQLFPDQIELTDLFDYPSIAALASFLEQQIAKQE
ncbi:non-ribosomal peptide synthetase [Methyloprofundus sp.]|uniref:non-ribosomal peptide synthetase n=1 Tax=Methyloprofundus sp. TaxID=2020875 RepID=UPI003D10A9CA